MNRETIFVALFQKLAAVDGIKSSSRRLKHWSDVSPADCPALFVTQKTETIEQQKNRPPKRVMEADVYVYVKTDGDHNDIPATQLNAIVDAVEAAMAPRAGEQTMTLGGLVEHCWIEGQIATDEGVLGDTALAIIPVRLLVV